MSCGNNVKQLGLGLHNYHAAYNQLPRQGGGTVNPTLNTNYWNDTSTNSLRISALVGLTPFVEQQAIWEQISNPLGGFQAMGNSPTYGSAYAPWIRKLVRSDARAILVAHPHRRTGRRGRTNYGFAVGDNPNRLETGDLNGNNKATSGDSDAAKQNCRGMFAMHQTFGFRDALDGTANTMAMAEMNTDLGDNHITTRPVRERSEPIPRLAKPRLIQLALNFGSPQEEAYPTRDRHQVVTAV